MAMLTHHNKSFLNNSYDNGCVNWGKAFLYSGGGAGEWLRVVEWLYARYVFYVDVQVLFSDALIYHCYSVIQWDNSYIQTALSR